MVRHISYFIIYTHVVFSSRYNNERRNTGDSDDENKNFERGNYNTAIDDLQKKTSFKNKLPGKYLYSEILLKPINKSSIVKHGDGIRQESQDEQPFFSRSDGNKHYTSKKNTSDIKPIGYERKTKRWNSFSCNSFDINGMKNEKHDAKNLDFFTFKNDLPDCETQEQRKNRRVEYSEYFPENDRFQSYESKSKSDLAYMVPEFKDKLPDFKKSDIKNCSIEKFSCIEFSKPNEPRLEPNASIFNAQLDLLNKNRFKKFINKHCENHAIFDNFVDANIKFSDIKVFIRGNFSLNGYFIKQNHKIFFDLIDCITTNEKIFWPSISDQVMIRYCAENLVNSVMKHDFCELNSPFLSYFPGIVNLKYFIRNLIYENPEQVKNSCLWILLLKVSESFCNLKYYAELIGDEDTCKLIHKKFKRFIVYNGNIRILSGLQRLFVIFENIAKKVFKCTGISTDYSIMLYFISINVLYRNIDMHIATRGHVYFSRVVSDCIFRMSPNIILLLIAKLKTYKLIDIQDVVSCAHINCLFFRLYQRSYKFDDGIQVDFKLIYLNVIESFIDFLKFELLSSKVFYDENSFVKDELKFIENIVMKYEKNEIILSNLKLNELMGISEVLCAIFNHFIKVGLNHQLHTKKYNEMSLLYFNRRIKDLYQILRVKLFDES